MNGTAELTSAMVVRNIHGLQTIHWIQRTSGSRKTSKKYVQKIQWIYSDWKEGKKYFLRDHPTPHWKSLENLTCLKLGTLGHLVDAGFSLSKNWRIISQDKATPLQPRHYPGLGTGPVVLFPQSLWICFLIIVSPWKMYLISQKQLNDPGSGGKMIPSPHQRFKKEHKVSISDFSPFYPITKLSMAQAMGHNRTANIFEVC